MSTNTKSLKKTYCKAPTKWLYRDRQKCWELDYDDYLKDKNWEYDFCHELSVGDCEQSFLSQMIFGHLFIKHFHYDAFFVKRTYIFLSKKKNIQNQICYHFDVMNNPKSCHKLGRDAEKKCIDKCKRWLEIYHTIGNFTPIPWTKNPKNLQLIHLHLGERWDCFLAYCQKEWHNWEEQIIDISFNEYLKQTCQQLYFNNLFIDFKKEHFNDLDKISSSQWRNIVDDWNKEIDEGKCSELFTFDGDINEVVSDIIFLIEARGRCIISLLQ